MKRTYVDFVGDYYDYLDDQFDQMGVSDNLLKKAFKRKASVRTRKEEL